jgi:FAD/FMN-containing dehydrogenase
VKASESLNDDLFWGLRGGGGNFGVVTSFTYRLHPVHTVGVGMTVWPIAQTPDVLRWYRDFLPRAERDLYGFFALLVVPPAPPFPEAIHGQKMCGIVWCYTGDLEGLDDTLAAVREPAEPAFHFAMAMPYPVLQALFDDLIPAGLQWYWRGDFFDQITDESIAVHLEYGSDIPTPLSTMHLYPVDGAVHDVPAGNTAFAHRDAVWSGVIGGIDPDPANAATVKDWSVSYWEALHPHSMGAGYVNFLMDEPQERVRAAYHGNYRRLLQIKGKYDPDNVFHVNGNIRPEAGAAA